MEQHAMSESTLTIIPGADGSTLRFDDVDVPPDAEVTVSARFLSSLLDGLRDIWVDTCARALHPGYAKAIEAACIEGYRLGAQAGADAAVKHLRATGPVPSVPVTSEAIARGVAAGLRDADLSLAITSMPQRTVERRVRRDQNGAITGTVEVESDV
jgi:hypothetical protein